MFRRRGLDLISSFIRSPRIRSPRIDLLRRVECPEAHAPMAVRSQERYRDICSSDLKLSERCSWFVRLGDLSRSPRIDLLRRVGFPSVPHQCYREICSSVSLSNSKEIASENSSERCSCCGLSGDIIWCKMCRQAFHAECLLSVPHPNCIDKGSSDQTIFVCDQCEKKFKRHNIRCLKLTKTYELKGIAKGTWFCSDQCSEINASLETAVSDGAMTVGSLAMDIINTKRLEKKQTKRKKEKKHKKTTNTKLVTDEAVAVHFRIVRGKGHNPRDNSLLRDACAIFHERFKEVKEGGIDLIPVMVNGRKLKNFDFKGMYCVLLIVRSVTVSAALLRIVGTVAQMPLVATRKEDDGKGYFQGLYVCIEEFLSSLGVSEIILPAYNKAEAMWKKKFGYREMKKKELIRYQDFMLSIFKGSAMLKKHLAGGIVLILHLSLGTLAYKKEKTFPP